MKVLITGAMGTIGTSATISLLEQGHQVRCFDLGNKTNRKRAEKLRGKAEIVWGDMRNGEDVAKAVEGMDAVIHLAFVLPPVTDNSPDLAKAVNVGGTRNLIDAMKKLSPRPRLIFSSSLTVFGDTQHLPPPRKSSDPVQATDNYTQHKIDCEKLCAESGLNWCVMRFAVVPPRFVTGITSKAFAFPFKSRLEFLAPADAGLALTHAVSANKAYGKILLVGGGKGCQLYYGDFLNGVMTAMGVGKLPEEAFGNETAYTDWLDTTESQSILNYQQHTFEAYLKDLPKMLGTIRHIMPLIRPIARWYVLRHSPYLKANKATKKGKS